MALIVKSYGNGSLGDVSEITATVNSCAAVTAITENSITIDATNKITGTADFIVNAKILLHVSATKSAVTYLGKWLVATITAVDGNTFTLDENPTKIIPAAQFANYYVQAVAFAQYKNLALGTGSIITPPVYSNVGKRGGIAAIMCSETLKFDGGHISLVDRGIPIANKALRPTFTYIDIEPDTTDYAGTENYCVNYCPLNSGDGVAFIFAKKLICSEESRIGNPATYGVQFHRGQANSVTYNETKPTNITNKGGSSIFIAAGTIENFSPKMIAKYHTKPAKSADAGQGICRCYIASNTRLRNDEGLYAYDCISDPFRLSRETNIKNFGNGSFGDVTGTKSQIFNNYATITAINGNKVTITNATTNGLAQIQQGALVMIHFNHKGNTNIEHAGRFILANVTDEYNGVLTLDAAPPDISITDYAAQVVSIPQFNNFTLTAHNTATPKFNGARGGIFAIAVKNNCNLKDGEINVSSKGGGGAYAREGLAIIGNAQNSNKLPIGQGNGSVFILAQNLTVDSKTHIGHGASGAGAYAYSSNGGSGAKGGTGGGYGSNGTFLSTDENPSGERQGAHLMIVADKITGFCLNAISTGGHGSAAAGHGYGGGYNGGAGVGATSTSYPVRGGSSGWAFVYCNHVESQDTTRIVLR